ncbi:MAG: SusD/RagB family nutrient-binding outer rane lipoprotein [Flavipsychrobacter sp.]|nr:SusD/RagB family nutrient-binding outer rane lipoprotein [Flavipsychrobacter sp.]
MLINKKIILASAVAGLTLGASSCRKFSDVNTNPNVSQTATVQTLLPAAQLYVGSAVGTDLQIYGSIWAQYWTQAPVSSQYAVLEQFAPGQDQFTYGWKNVYAGAENFYQLYNLADSLHKKQYKAIALIMQAYTFQVITDGWGDAPFKQALKGEYNQGHMINPEYDAQSSIYTGILAYLDSANKWINASDPSKPGADDLMYGGDMNQWKKFSNTLRLKILLRAIDAPGFKAAAKIDSFYNTNPAFIGDGDDAKIAYGFGSTNKNPLYAEESSSQLAGVQNLAASNTCLDSMNSNNDYRAAVFYSGSNGLAQGSYATAKPGSGYAIPTAYVAGDANDAASASAPVNFLTAEESYFLQAEAAARNLGTDVGNDETLFMNGIKASFEYYGSGISATTGATGSEAYDIYVNGDVTNSIPSAYWSHYPATGNKYDKLRFIITQKWFAMCGNQGFEAWTEWRRTGFPDFLVNPASSAIGANKPARFLYPTTESTVNAGFPGLKPLTAKVWWDVN